VISKRFAFRSCLSILAAAAALAIASPAFAAAAGPAASIGSRVTQPARTASAALTYTVTTRPATRVVQISATTKCYDGVYQRVDGYEFGVLVWWEAMKTNFCYNGHTVTSHSTKMSHGILASAWSYAPGPTKFNCFDRKKGVSCSGNHEHNTSGFQNTGAHVATSVNIDEWEYYTGRWRTHWSTLTA
jgi:hypothetical protein